ncbi:MAG: DsbA family protein [Ardenticatenaceae bacterium]|nr:DsbA family protein [Ardenticatenaceae bacterium]HBY99294.1 hypothetical protein [Chloroflexota bacterium]
MENQPVQIEVFFSYACRDSYQVFAWLKRVQAQGVELRLTWSPFAIQLDGASDDWRQPWERANSELRGFIAAEAARRQGADAFRRFHHALEAAVHEQFLELGEEDTLLGAAEEAGLDVGRFRAAWHSPDLAYLARQSHERAVEHFDVFGTPTLVFANGQALHLELAAIPPETEAVAVFRALVALAVDHPYVAQLKRTTPLSTG